MINEELLRESKMIRGNVDGLKILGNGELKHALTIEADKVSASAREKIESAGGTVTLREVKRPDGPRHEAKPAAETAERRRRKRRSRPRRKLPQKGRREEEVVREELALGVSKDSSR